MTASDLAADVRRFYAWQLRHVDEGALDACTDTFTEDAVLIRRARGAEPRRAGRDVIVAGLRTVIENRAAAGVVRRQWLGDLVVRPAGDHVRARYYLMALDTPRGGQPVLRNSTVVEDELVRTPTGWQVRSRVQTHDDVH